MTDTTKRIAETKFAIEEEKRVKERTPFRTALLLETLHHLQEKLDNESVKD